MADDDSRATPAPRNAAENRAAKALAMVTPELEPGEGIEAVLPSGQTGPSPWLTAMVPFLMYLLAKAYAVVVTDRRVLFIRCSTWTGQARGLEMVYTRSAVGVIEWRPRGLWSTLRLECDGRAIRLNVARPFRQGAEEVAAALAPPSAASS